MRLSSIEDSDSKKYYLGGNVEHVYPQKQIKFYGGGIGIPTENNEIVPENVGEYFTTEEIKKLKKGTAIYHKRFGFGELLKIMEAESQKGKKTKGEIRFNESGVETLLLEFARLRKVL